MTTGAQRKSIEDEAHHRPTEGTGAKAILALNKIDLVERSAASSMAKALNDAGVYSRRGHDLRPQGRWRRPAGRHDRRTHARSGPYLFPEDQSADLPSACSPPR
jgi:GTPase Era involved in 16S rRNA processing